MFPPTTIAFTAGVAHFGSSLHCYFKLLATILQHNGRAVILTALDIIPNPAESNVCRRSVECSCHLGFLEPVRVCRELTNDPTTHVHDCVRCHWERVVSIVVLALPGRAPGL